MTPPLIEKFQRAGQGHVFAFFAQLPPEGQKRLLDEAAEIDLDEVAHLTRTLLAKNAASGVSLPRTRAPPGESVRRPSA